MSVGCSIQVAGRKIIATGQFTAQEDELVQITNISGIENLIVKFKVTFEDETSEVTTQSRAVEGEIDSVLITLTKRWTDVNFNKTGNSGVIFAEDTNNIYKFSYIFQTIGGRSKYLYIMIFTITSEQSK